MRSTPIGRGREVSNGFGETLAGGLIVTYTKLALHFFHPQLIKGDLDRRQTWKTNFLPRVKGDADGQEESQMAADNAWIH